jgi:nitrite reductase (NADH) large subunit
LHFRSGEQLRVQMVIIAVGIRPRAELAEGCGLEVHSKGGVIVTDLLATSDPRIFAIGECASHRGMFYGLAAPGYQMATALSSTLCGRPRQFIGADQSTHLKLPGISIAALGEFQAGSSHLVSKTEESYRRIALERNRVVGALAVGNWPEQQRLREVIGRRGRMWRWQRERFVRTGDVWPSKRELPVAQWPADAIICNCTGVRRGALSAACAAGCASTESLARATGASTVCGSCRPLLEELVGDPAAPATIPGTRVLAVAALLSALVAAAIVLLPGLQAPLSVQGSWNFAALVHNHLVRQISGFTLTGLVLGSMILSLRKRIRRFRWGEVGTWKAIHATAGLLTLVALISHTGFRLGQNLNFVLMCNFLAIAAAGALTGMVTALEQRLPARTARRMRAVWTGAHIVLVWPLPILVLFHVFVSFRF